MDVGRDARKQPEPPVVVAGFRQTFQNHSNVTFARTRARNQASQGAANANTTVIAASAPHKKIIRPAHTPTLTLQTVPAVRA